MQMKTMRYLKSLMNDEEGATRVEIGLLLALLAVVVISVVALLNCSSCLFHNLGNTN
jgi:Flp pilus assembly pilin Flp